MHTDLIVLFEMVNLLAEVVNSEAELRAIVEKNQQDIKLNVVWAISAMAACD